MFRILSNGEMSRREHGMRLVRRQTFIGFVAGSAEGRKKKMRKTRVVVVTALPVNSWNGRRQTTNLTSERKLPAARAQIRKRGRARALRTEMRNDEMPPYDNKSDMSAVA